MAKHKSLSSTQPRNAFADGAARFAEIARQVKAQQVSEQRGGRDFAKPVQADAPDEIWARKFMSQAIGPTGTDGVTAAAPVWHGPRATAEFAALRQAMQRSQEVAPKRDLGVPVRPGAAAPMAARLGKKDEKPRRSWLGRLIRGS